MNSAIGSEIVPHQVVDDLVSKDFREQRSSTYTIYVLNPTKIRSFYAYSQEFDGVEDINKCSTVMWAGTVGFDLLLFGPLEFFYFSRTATSG